MTTNTPLRIDAGARHDGSASRASGNEGVGMSSMQGRVGIVTGASRGIGAATARELAAGGMAVVLLARDEKAIEAIADEIRGLGGRAVALACDVSRYADVETGVACAVEAFGSLDVLVNNAGTIEPVARIERSDPDDWGRVVDINLKGVYHGIRAALPAMLEGGRGVIVNLSSGAATGALEGWSHYCATKAAVLALTRCTHLEHADSGIRCVGLSPGTVATDMQVAIRGSGVNPVSRLEPTAHMPPEAAARAIAWLCTDEARDLDGGEFSLKTEEGRRRAGLMDGRVDAR